MIIDLGMNWENFYKDNIVAYIKSLQNNNCSYFFWWFSWFSKRN